MSEIASRERAVRQTWAVPGGNHDRLVRVAKVALPSAVGVLVAFLALAPLDRNGDVSFILDKKKVENAPERMRVETARYVGEDNRGQKFQITARTAVQRSSDEQIVDIRGMFVRLGLAQGPVMIGASQGRYDLDQQKVSIQGPVRVVGPDDYRLATRDVTVDLKNRQVSGTGQVSGQMSMGQFQAGRLRADLGEQTVLLDGGRVTGTTRLGQFEAGRVRANLKERVMVMDGGARLKIVQGAVR